MQTYPGLTAASAACCSGAKKHCTETTSDLLFFKVTYIVSLPTLSTLSTSPFSSSKRSLYFSSASAAFALYSSSNCDGPILMGSVLGGSVLGGSVFGGS